MEKLRVREVVVVEGKYDAAALATQIDGLIMTTDGFSIFTDKEKTALLRALGRERGLLILTDSDAAGFAIRSHVAKIARGCKVKHAYVPAVAGKESRKEAPSKEGLLGVEGLPPAVLREALERAGVVPAQPKQGRPITYTDLYEAGLSGGAGSAERRRALLARLGLPPRLSKKALVEVLSTLYSYEEFAALQAEKPALFWDFHGTLTTPDITWFEAAMAAAAEAAPEAGMTREAMEDAFGRRCLPWWELPGGDTRHVTGSGPWWAFCEKEFAAMFRRAGLGAAQAEKAAPLLRRHILDPAAYTLYPDAIPTLRALQKRGYRSYLLSNNFPELAQVAAGLGLAPYLCGTVVSGQVGFEKPRGEIFAAAKRAAGYPAAAWMIGDSRREDILGGRAEGFMTVVVHGAEAPEADHRVGELAEILALLP